jgi:ATP-dependent DNA ligase
MPLPLSELLGSLQLDGPHWQTSALFEDGEALFCVAQERGLEGVVAKRLRDRYRPGVAAGIKIKNRTYWRWEIEREAAIRLSRA